MYKGYVYSLNINSLSLSHDFSHSIIIGWETQRQTDAPHPEGSHSIGVETLKIVDTLNIIKREKVKIQTKQ